MSPEPEPGPGTGSEPGREPQPSHEPQPPGACGHDTPPADSAGVPWHGRAFEANSYADDDGTADPRLLAALSAPRSEASAHIEVVDAYREARLLVPLIAEKGDTGVGPTGLVVDMTQELSLVTVAAPDGRRVQPVFTSVAALAAWDPQARPVPADGIRTALAAVNDGTDLIVIDPGSPTQFVLRRPAVWAIGKGEPWEPSWANPAVFLGLQASVGAELAVQDVRMAPGDEQAQGLGPELVVHLELTAGLTQGELDVVLQRLARRWAADDAVATLVDSLTVKLHRRDA